MIEKRIVEVERGTGRDRHYRRLFLHELPAFLEANPGAWDQRLIPVCQCCGSFFDVEVFGRGQMRCPHHIGRNPCAVEGCKRTGSAPKHRGGHWYSNDNKLCGEHVRLAIPPGSPQRKVLLRILRVARKLGWNEELEARYWRIWPRIVRMARARAAGDLDEAEINRMFGWGEAA